MDNAIYSIKMGAMMLGAVIGAVIGELDGIMKALIAFMVIDYLTGVIVAWNKGTLSSGVGFWGLVKKVFILFLVIVGNMLDVHVIGSGAVTRSAVIAFYLANEGLSILENVGKLGVPYPEKLRKVLAQLKEDDNGNS